VFLNTRAVAGSVAAGEGTDGALVQPAKVMKNKASILLEKHFICFNHPKSSMNRTPSTFKIVNWSILLWQISKVKRTVKFKV
jgi:hypothetical protein